LKENQDPNYQIIDMYAEDVEYSFSKEV